MSHAAPASLSQSTSADFWQKSHSGHQQANGASFRGGGAAPAATSGELAAAYWAPGASPFYGGGGGRAAPPPGAASPTMKQRFPLQLPAAAAAPPAQPQLPRAKLERYGAPPPPAGGGSIGYKLANQQRVGAPPMMLHVSEQQRQQPQPLQSQPRQLQLQQQQPGVWTVEAERLAAREQQQRRPQQQQGKLQLQQAPPPGALVKYGEKTPRSNGNSASSGGGGNGGGRKPQRWGRFVQTLCCCLAPNRSSAAASADSEKMSPMNGGASSSEKAKPPQTPPQHLQQVQPQQPQYAQTQLQLQQQAAYANGGSSNGNGHGMPPAGLITQIQRPSAAAATNGAAAAAVAASANPITQIVQNGDGKSGLNGATAYQQAEITISPGSYKPPPLEKPLLPPLQPRDANRKCLIIDLDETLVHSSFKPVKNPDFVIPVEIDGVVHQVYVLKRPYVDEFLARVGEKFECVLFTASLAKYADPVANLLDKRGVFRSRLFREACVFHKGNYIKDLARLGRDLNRTVIVDNSPTSYLFHPDNAIGVQTWFDEPSDVELLDILPLLDRLAQVDSVYSVLRGTNSSPDSAALLDRPYS